MDKERADMDLQLKRLKHELHTAQLELNKTANQYKDAQNQIQTLSRERGTCVKILISALGNSYTSLVCYSKYMYIQSIEMLPKCLFALPGVAMRDNAMSYQQSIQLESKLKELEAERQILKQQRDIANKEREKVVMDSVSHKVSLHTPSEEFFITGIIIVI